jgi:hypothetical protein
MLAVEQAMEAHAALDLAGIPEDFKDVYGGVTIDHVTSSLVVQYDASADADRVAHFLDAVADLELQGYPLTLRAVAFTWDELWRVADMIGANSAAYAAEFGVPIDGFAVGIDPVEGTVFVETPAADAALPSTVEVSGIPVEIRTGAPRVSFEF